MNTSPKEWSNAGLGVSAVILAGGKSLRMGQDKAMLPFEGRPLIQHIGEQLQSTFSETIVAASGPEKYAFLGLHSVSDEFPGQGPMAGIASGLAAAQHALAFFVACDVPWIDFELVERLLHAVEGHDAAVPMTVDGHFEPLFAVYRETMLPHFRGALRAGQRRILAAYPSADVVTVPMQAHSRLENINTAEDYRRAMDASASRIRDFVLL